MNQQTTSYRQSARNLTGLCLFLFLSLCLSFSPSFSRENDSLEIILTKKLNAGIKDISTVDLLNKLAKLHAFSHAEKTIEYSKLAFEMAGSINYYKGIAIAAYQLGSSYTTHQDYKKAISFFIRSAEVYEKGKKHGLAINSYHGAARAFHLLKNYDSALVYYNRSLKLSQANNLSIYQAESLHKMGKVYIETGNNKEAMNSLKGSLALYEKLTNIQEIGELYHDIATVYKSNYQHSEALRYFIKSIEEYEVIGNDGEIDLLMNEIVKMFAGANPNRSTKEVLQVQLAHLMSEYKSKELNLLEKEKEVEKLKALVANRSKLITEHKSKLEGSSDLIVLLIILIPALIFSGTVLHFSIIKRVKYRNQNLMVLKIQELQIAKKEIQNLKDENAILQDTLTKKQIANL